MLINTTLSTVFDPSLYKGRLVFVVDTDNRMECGVFSGKYDGFENKLDMNKRQSVIHDELWSGAGLEVFEVSIPRLAQKDQSRSYRFVLIKWINSVYSSGYPNGFEFSLVDTNDQNWYLSFDKVTVILPDYEMKEV